MVLLQLGGGGQKRAVHSHYAEKTQHRKKGKESRQGALLKRYKPVQELWGRERAKGSYMGGRTPFTDLTRSPVVKKKKKGVGV